MGGGLGHLTRAYAFLHDFGLLENATILTTSRFAKDKRVVGNVDLIEVTEEIASNENAYKNFLRQQFQDNTIETIYIDSFPFGIRCEFLNFDFGETKINYIARLLDWNRYSGAVRFEKTPSFETCFILEDLETAHREFISRNTNNVQNLSLNYPLPALSNETMIAVEEIEHKNPFWLIVHSGDQSELSELVDFADEQRIIENQNVELIIITPIDYRAAVSNCLVFDVYPASVLFPLAARIFTGCGFNVMNQTKDVRNKHQFIPFSRRYDNQYRRAGLIRNSQPG